MDEHRKNPDPEDSNAAPGRLKYQKPQVQKLDVYETTALGACNNDEFTVEEPEPCNFNS